MLYQKKNRTTNQRENKKHEKSKVSLHQALPKAKRKIRRDHARFPIAMATEQAADVGEAMVEDPRVEVEDFVASSVGFFWDGVIVGAAAVGKSLQAKVC